MGVCLLVLYRKQAYMRLKRTSCSIGSTDPWRILSAVKYQKQTTPPSSVLRISFCYFV